MSSDFDAIKIIVKYYFDALYDGDYAKIGSIFHAKSKIYTHRDGELSETGLADYLKVVQGRETPRALGSARKDEALSIIINSPVAATVVVRLILFKNDYTDQLSLIKDQGEWKIMTKIFYANGVID